MQVTGEAGTVQVCCSWCGQLSRPEPACQVCGSPLVAMPDFELPAAGPDPATGETPEAADGSPETGDGSQETVVRGSPGGVVDGIPAGARWRSEAPLPAAAVARAQSPTGGPGAGDLRPEPAPPWAEPVRPSLTGGRPPATAGDGGGLRFRRALDVRWVLEPLHGWPSAPS
jgi:hypothetical protein